MNDFTVSLLNPLGLYIQYTYTIPVNRIGLTLKCMVQDVIVTVDTHRIKMKINKKYFRL